MITAKPNELELLKFWQESDPAAGIRINFPVDAQTGAASSAAVYFEVEPEHTSGGTRTAPRRSCSSSRARPRRS